MARGSPAAATLRLHGELGRPLVLQTSTNLRERASISTNTAVSGGVVIAQTMANPPRLFYRVAGSR